MRIPTRLARSRWWSLVGAADDRRDRFEVLTTKSTGSVVIKGDGVGGGGEFGQESVAACGDALAAEDRFGGEDPFPELVSRKNWASLYGDGSSRPTAPQSPSPSR